jgi:hypothetical protein
MTEDEEDHSESELQDYIKLNKRFLFETREFEEIDNSFYLEGVDLSIPLLLVKEFIDCVSKNDGAYYEALKKFWLKCCLNPNPQSREDLFIFLKKHQFKIDRHGNFYAYRRVVSKNQKNKDLVEFIASTWTYISGISKKNPNKFNVYLRNGNYNFKNKKAD